MADFHIWISNINQIDIRYWISNIQQIDIQYSNSVKKFYFKFWISNMYKIDIGYWILNINHIDIQYWMLNIHLIDICYSNFLKKIIFGFEFDCHSGIFNVSISNIPQIDIRYSYVKIYHSNIEIQSQKWFFLESLNIEYKSGGYSTFNIDYRYGGYSKFKLRNEIFNKVWIWNISLVDIRYSISNINLVDNR